MEISVGYCKKDITPLLSQWSYVFLALTHRYGLRKMTRTSLYWTVYMTLLSHSATQRPQVEETETTIQQFVHLQLTSNPVYSERSQIRLVCILERSLQANLHIKRLVWKKWLHHESILAKVTLLHHLYIWSFPFVVDHQCTIWFTRYSELHIIRDVEAILQEWPRYKISLPKMFFNHKACTMQYTLTYICKSSPQSYDQNDSYQIQNTQGLCLLSLATRGKTRID